MLVARCGLIAGVIACAIGVIASPVYAGFPKVGFDPRPHIPGAIDVNVRQDNINSTICILGYARSVRPSYTFTGTLKKKMMRAQHPGEPFQAYELDHPIPLSLGSAPADARRNLWLQPWNSAMNAGDKDALEYVLWRLVCGHQLPLGVAQTAIARDWISAYRKYATRENLARYHFHQGDAG